MCVIKIRRHIPNCGGFTSQSVYSYQNPYTDEGQRMQWQNEKGKAYGPQETEQKTYIWEVRAPQQSVVNSGAPEEQAVSAP